MKEADGLENAIINLTTTTLQRPPSETIIKIFRNLAQPKLSSRIFTHKYKLILTHSLNYIFVDNLVIVQLHFVLEGWIYRHNPIF